MPCDASTTAIGPACWMQTRIRGPREYQYRRAVRPLPALKCPRVIVVDQSHEGAVLMQISTIGFDITKIVFQVHGVDADENVVVRKQLRCSQVTAFFATLPPCLIGIEACARAHHGAGVDELGHKVGLTPGARSARRRAHSGAYSPEARGRSERMFATLQDRLVKELGRTASQIASASAASFLSRDGGLHISCRGRLAPGNHAENRATICFRE
jgi:hypothetical protein